MKKVPTVTVGICALNEERYIQQVLKGVLKQQGDSFKVIEILVFSDGSRDKTVQNARSVHSSLITIHAFTERKGKTHRLRELFAAAKGEIVVMFDADIDLLDTHVIDNLVMPFVDQQVALVGGNSRPHKPSTFVEKAVQSTFDIFYASRKYVRGGDNIFGCTGSILAGRTKFLNEFRLPDIINEDAFLYMTCVEKGLTFRYVDNAIVEYQLPKNTRDYIRQVLRSDPKSVTQELESYFTASVKEQFHRPTMFYLNNVFNALLRNPRGVLYIVFVTLMCRLAAPIVLKNYKLEWFTAKSTH